MNYSGYYFNILTSSIMTKTCLVGIGYLFFSLHWMQYCSLLKPLLWRWIFPVPLLLQAHTPCRCFFFLHMRAKSKGQVRGRGQTVALYPNRNPVCPVCFPVSALPGPHMDYCKTRLSHVIFIPIRSKKDPYLFNVLKKEKKEILQRPENISAVT